MATLIKAVLTAAAIVAIAWPLIFWGNPATPQVKASQDIEQQPWPQHPYTISPRYDLQW